MAKNTKIVPKRNLKGFIDLPIFVTFDRFVAFVVKGRCHSNQY